MSRLIEVAKVEELKSGTMKKVFAEGREVLLARVGDKYYATDNQCPHMKVDLSQGKLEGTIVTCPDLPLQPGLRALLPRRRRRRPGDQRGLLRPQRAGHAGVLPVVDQLGAFAPLPVVMVSDANLMSPARINLGRRLFYETLLSEDHQMSCNSCHDLQAYGVDGHRFSTGVKGRLGGRNAPSVYNAAAHVAQFWDGRAATIEEQAKGPILNPVEMGMPNSKEVIKHLRADPTYVEMLKTAFPGQTQPVTWNSNVTHAGPVKREA